MIANYDFYNRYEQPTLILCNPDDTEIGIIVGAEEFNSNICFGDISDISYKLYLHNGNSINNEFIYEKHIERRQVRVEGLGYFIISGCSEYEDEKGIYKSVQVKSCEYELNGVAMPYISGTYQLYKVENFTNETNEEIANREDEEYLNDNCLLYEIMKVIPSWTLDNQIDFVQDEKYEQLAKMFRTFEDKDTSVYSFLVNDLQDSFECSVSFDIENRRIRILHYDDVFKELPMVISEANILDSCEISTTIDNYVNSMDVKGTDGVSINTYNPLGHSVIYNFDHDIAIGLIDGILKEALEYWKRDIKSSVTYSGDYYCEVPVIQTWLNSADKLSGYKKSLLEAIGTGAEYKVSEILDSDDFLTEVGLSGSERSTFITLVRNAIWAENEGVSEYNPNTSKIDNLFLEISFKKANLISSGCFYEKNEELSLSKLSKLLYYAQELRARIQMEVDSLNSYLNGYNSQREALNATVVEDDADQSRLNEEVNKVNEYILKVNNSLEIYNGTEGVAGTLEIVDTIIEKISELLSDTYSYNGFEKSFERFLSENPSEGLDAGKLYADLTRYIKQQTYTDDTIVITEAMSLEEKFEQEEELYNSSVRLLSKISVPAYEISVGVEAFMFSGEYADIAEQISIKSALYIELPSGDVPLFHLLKITTNHSENSCEFTFGNRMRLSDPASVFSDLQNTVSCAASIAASERVNWGIQKEKINNLMLEKNAAIDTTYRSMSNSFNKTIFGDDGFRCYAVDDDNNKTYGMWCANGTMMFTDGETPKMAIGRIIKSNGDTEYGFYGQSILANTVTADKLVAGALSKGTNYIRNGSFESGVDYWNIPTDQTVSSSSTFISPVGHKYLLLNSGKTAVQNLYVSSSYILRGTYVLSFYCRRNDSSQGVEGLDGLSAVFMDNNTEIVRCNFSDKDAFYVYRDSQSDYWARCHVVFEVSEAITKPVVKIVNNSPYHACVDGVMLEKSVDLNEYTPHISESYAKYTTIDDSGVTVYNGKIKILNNDGDTVFGADADGNLSLTGTITASSGKIGGWNISSDKLYNGNVGMQSSGQNVFYAGTSTDYNFKVSRNGFLFARQAEIDKKLTLKNGSYTMEFDGYSILMKYGNSTQFSSAISFASTQDGLFSGTNNANLAIAGSTKILFGTRPGGNWKALCEIEHAVSGSTLNAFYFKPSGGLMSIAYLGSSANRWNDLYLNGLTSITGVATGSVKNYINWCETKINYLLSKAFIDSILGWLVP